MEPKLSVALPVYNGANYLAEALDSVLSQTFGDFELVVSDNCSTDETPRILEEYARRDSRILVFRTDQFLPQADNVNRSVELCRAEWVKLFCHDDLMKPDCLEVVQYATTDDRATTVGLVGNGEEWLFEDGNRYSLNPSMSTIGPLLLFNGRDFLRENFVFSGSIPLPALTTATVRKRAWSLSGRFDRRFSHFDVFLWMEMLRDWDYMYISSVITSNRIHESQVAVAIGKSFKTVSDYRIFWREYLHAHRTELGLDRKHVFLISLKPVSVAGNILGMHLIEGNAREGLKVFFRTPISWWPLLPLFAYRNVSRERHKRSAMQASDFSSSSHMGGQ